MWEKRTFKAPVRRMTALLALILVVCMLAGCAAPRETKFFVKDSFGNTPYARMKYEHIDPTQLYADIAAFRALGTGERNDKRLLALYDEIIAAQKNIYTQYTLIEIKYNQAPNDDEIKTEQTYTMQLMLDVNDAVMGAIRDVLLTENGTALRAQLRTGEVKAYLDYRDMTDRERELAMEEDELTTEYDRLMVNLDVTAEVDGKTWDYDSLIAAKDDLSDEEKAVIFDAIEKEINLVAGGIYQELVAIHVEQAKETDYDSFVDYIYSEGFGRDYTKEDAQAFQAAVKKNVAPRFYAELYNNEAVLYGDAGCDVTPAEALRYIGKYAPDISSEIYDSFAYLKRYNLYDLTTDEEKIDAGFTTFLPAYDSPFIYNMCYADTSRTLSDNVHEFGHFTQMHYVPTRNMLTDSESYDIAEVNSQGLDLLYDAYYPEIFGKDKAPLVRANHLYGILSAVISGCMQDEFQQYVFAHPEASLDEWNQAYFDIAESYGVDHTDMDHDYNWMYIHHTFSSPFYYISYATSALTALDIWAQSQTDRKAAIDTYLLFTSYGISDFGYLELLKASGMEDFRDAEYVARVANQVMDEIEALAGMQTQTEQAA